MTDTSCPNNTYCLLISWIIGEADVLGGSVPLLDGSADGPVVVLVRPEHISISPDPGGNAVVVTASFLGAHGKVTTTTDDGEQVVVQVGSNELAAYGPGSRVRVSPRGDVALAVAR